jgi:hypothetical protein
MRIKVSLSYPSKRSAAELHPKIDPSMALIEK